MHRGRRAAGGGGGLGEVAVGRENRVSLFARQQPAVDCQLAAFRHNVDLHPAANQPDRSGGRAEQRMAGSLGQFGMPLVEGKHESGCGRNGTHAEPGL